VAAGAAVSFKARQRSRSVGTFRGPSGSRTTDRPASPRLPSRRQVCAVHDEGGRSCEARASASSSVSMTLTAKRVSARPMSSSAVQSRPMASSAPGHSDYCRAFLNTPVAASNDNSPEPPTKRIVPSAFALASLLKVPFLPCGATKHHEPPRLGCVGGPVHAAGERGGDGEVDASGATRQTPILVQVSYPSRRSEQDDGCRVRCR
jgi:hypothetical protein